MIGCHRDFPQRLRVEFSPDDTVTALSAVSLSRAPYNEAAFRCTCVASLLKIYGEFVVWAGFVVHVLYIRMQLCVIVGFVENIPSIFIISPPDEMDHE